MQMFKNIEQKIEKASVISFDFYDTLFFRSLCEPEDAFDILGRKLGITNFRDLRKQAQAEAFRRMHLAGRQEIGLKDIYVCFDDMSAVETEAAMKAEYDLELSLLHPNSELIPLFFKCLALGKRVVITSDMYLPTRFFLASFELHRISNVPMFISSDRNATKRDFGHLFDLVASELAVAPSEILHIGDNIHSDVKMAEERGVSAFHYIYSRVQTLASADNPAASVALGMLKTHASEITPNSSEEVGFLLGGPAAVGYLEWIVEQAQKDRIDILLFLSRDGYVLNEIAQANNIEGLPKFEYFLGSRTAFTLAAINDQNFLDFLPFLLSGADNLSPFEVLERIGVAPPAPEVMSNLGFGPNYVVNTCKSEMLEKFLYAYRWEILKVCRKNRHGLYNSLLKLGIHEGSRVGLVDVGWRGTTQEAFELAISDFFDIEVFGYYFCLAEGQSFRKRRPNSNMTSMISSNSISKDVVEQIYQNRVAVETFFSAPHPSVIGLSPVGDGFTYIEDLGRNACPSLPVIVSGICEGMKIFAKHFYEIRHQIGLRSSPLEIVKPLVDFVTNGEWNNVYPFTEIKNFDAWASSRNHTMILADYKN